MKRNAIVIILCLIFAGIAVVSGYKLVTGLLEYKAGEDAYRELQQFISVSDKTTEPAVQPQPDDVPEQTAQQGEDPAVETTAPVVREPAPIQVDFDMLLEINSDVVGWIYLEDSQINFPVAQGKDNKEYLYWLINGDYNGAGTPFMDYRNAPDYSDCHTIIYGHNMNNGTMFADIHKYINQEYYDTHPIIHLLTPQGDYQIEVFAGYIAHIKEDAWKLIFDTEEDFAQWLVTSKEKSAFVSDVVPTVEDRILTLSTCSDSANQTRFVLLGIIR